MSFPPAEEPEPYPRPPPPQDVPVPDGWQRLKKSSPALDAFAVDVLHQRQPIGDVQTTVVDGRSVGALTEYHWDNHVDHTWKWHRGISLIVKKA